MKDKSSVQHSGVFLHYGLLDCLLLSYDRRPTACGHVHYKFVPLGMVDNSNEKEPYRPSELCVRKLFEAWHSDAREHEGICPPQLLFIGYRRAVAVISETDPDKWHVQVF